jgi:hypothetical protein
MVPPGSLEITVKNPFPSEQIPSGTLFLTVISRGTKGNHILLRICFKVKRLPVEMREIKLVPQGFSENYC